MKRVLLVCLMLLLCVTARAADKVHTFAGSTDQVFNAAVHAAQKNWTVTNTDRETGTMSFTTGTSLKTWGMDCSVQILQTAPGQIKVTLRTQKKMQMYAWKVGDSIAEKFFAAIDAELAAAQSPPAAETGGK